MNEDEVNAQVRDAQVLNTLRSLYDAGKLIEADKDRLLAELTTAWGQEKATELFSSPPQP